MELALSIIHIDQSCHLTRAIGDRYRHIERPERHIGANAAMDGLGSVLGCL